MNPTTPNTGPKRRSYLDTAAIALSGICLLHCLALPIALTALPIFNIALLDEATFHAILLIFILPISVIALSIGCRQHKDTLTLILGLVGLGILTVMAFFGHDLVGLTGERVGTSIGGVILALAHIQNFRRCREHDCQHEHAQSELQD